MPNMAGTAGTAGTAHAEPAVSIVVVPREGFRQAPERLERLLARTTTPFRLVYVDGGSPRPVAGEIRERVAAHGGTLVRTERFLRPSTARNLGLREVGTRYVVFLDNDVIVTAGWLDALVRCADETGAAVVSPVICIGGGTPPVVHVAGGENRLETDGAGRRRLVESYAHAGRPLADVLAEVRRRPTEMAEFHAVLVRTELLRELGGLDEGCPTAFEHNDLCLAVTARGGTIWLEPGAVVDYVKDRATAPANAPYHLLRWSRAWIDESLAGFCAKWGVDPDDPGLRASLDSLHARRRRPVAPLRRRPRVAPRLDGVMDGWVERALLARHDRRPPRPRISRW